MDEVHRRDMDRETEDLREILTFSSSLGSLRPWHLTRITSYSVWDGLQTVHFHVSVRVLDPNFHSGFFIFISTTISRKNIPVNFYFINSCRSHKWVRENF